MVYTTHLALKRLIILNKNHNFVLFQANKKQPKKAAPSSPQKESKANLSTTTTTTAVVSGGSSNSHTPEQQALYDSVTAQGDKSEKAAKVSHFSSPKFELFSGFIMDRCNITNKKGTLIYPRKVL